MELPEIKQNNLTIPQADFNLPVSPSISSVSIPSFNELDFDAMKSANRYRYTQQQWMKEQDAKRAAAQAEFDAQLAATRAATEEKMKYLSDYKSTSEVNSFADLIYNRLEKTFDMVVNPTDYTWQDRWLSSMSRIPGLSLIDTAEESMDLINRTVVQPLRKDEEGKRDWQTFGTNMLYNFGETADIIANPVKAVATAIFDDDKDTTVGGNLKSAFGIGTEGRENFDIDYSKQITNPALRFASEIATEVALDPLSYLTLGTSAAAKTTARKAAQEGLTELPERAAREIANSVARAMIDGDTAEAAVSKAVKGAQRRAARLYNKAKAGKIPMEKLTKAYGDDMLLGLTDEMVEKGILNNNAYKVASSIKTARTWEQIDSAIMRAAFGTSTLFVPQAIKAIIKSPTGEAFGQVLKRLGKAWEPYNKVGTDVTKITEFDRAASDYLDELRINRLVDFIDNHKLGEAVVDIRFADMALDEMNNIRNILKKTTKDPMKMVSELDAYVKNAFPELKDFNEYTQVISDIAGRGSNNGAMNKLNGTIELVKGIYQTQMQSALIDFVNKRMDEIEGLTRGIDDYTSKLDFKNPDPLGDIYNLSKMLEGLSQEISKTKSSAVYKHIEELDLIRKESADIVDEVAELVHYNYIDESDIVDSYRDYLERMLVKLYGDKKQGGIISKIVEDANRTKKIVEHSSGSYVKLSERLAKFDIGDIDILKQMGVLKDMANTISDADIDERLVSDVGKTVDELDDVLRDVNLSEYSEYLSDLLKETVKGTRESLAKANTKAERVTILNGLAESIDSMVDDIENAMLRADALQASTAAKKAAKELDVTAADRIVSAAGKRLEDIKNTRISLQEEQATLKDLVKVYEAERELDLFWEYTNLLSDVERKLDSLGAEEQAIRNSTSEIVERATTETVVTDAAAKELSGRAIVDNLTKTANKLRDLTDSADIEYRVSTDEGKTYYRLKLSQIHNTIKILETPGVRELMNDITTRKPGTISDSLYALFEDVRPEFADDMQAAVNVIARAEAMQNYDFFVQMTMNAGLPDDITIPFLDTVQSGAGNLFSNFDAKEEEYIFSVLDRTVRQLNTTKLEESLSLEKMFNKHGIEIANHDAAGDVQGMIELMDKELDMTEFVGPNETKVWYDIETLGVNKHSDPVIQIAHTDADGKIVNMRALSNEMPNYQLRRKLAPKKYKTDYERRVWFRDTYMNPDKAGQTIDGVKYYATEKEMLEDFRKYAIDLETADAAPVMIGHNIHQFDESVLRNRMKHNDMETISHIRSVDTLELLRDKYGYRYLDPRESRTLKQNLQWYFNSMRNLTANDIYAPKAGEGVAPAMLDFISTPNRAFFDDLTSAERAIQNMHSTSYVNELDGQNVSQLVNRDRTRIADVRKAIIDTLTTIKDTNGYYGNFFLEIDDAFAEKVGKNPELYPWNVTKALNLKALEDGNFMETGYKTVNNNDMIRNFYKNQMDATNKMEVRDVMRLQKSAQNLQRMADRVDDGLALIPFRKDMLAIIDQVQRNLPSMLTDISGFGKSIYGQNAGRITRMLEDPAFTINVTGMRDKELYAVANRYRYIVNQIDLMSGGTGTRKLLDDPIDPNLLSLLDRPETLKFGGWSDVDGVFLDPKFTSDEVIETAHHMNAELLGTVQGFDTFRGRMEELSRIEQENKIIMAEARLKVAMSKDISEAFHAVNDYVDTFRHLLDTEPDEFARRYNAVVDHLETYQNELGKQAVHSALNRTPDELLSHLYHKAFGVITFTADDLLRTDTSPGKAMAAFIELRRQQDELERLGIKIHEAEDGRVWIYLDRNKTYDHVKEVYDKHTFDAMPIQGGPVGINEKVLNDAFQKAKDAIEFHSGGAGRNSLGETFDRTGFSKVHEAMPDAVKEAALGYEHFDSKHMFDGVVFNRSVLGSIDSKKDVVPYISRNILKNYTQSIQRMAQNTDAVSKYAAIFDDSSRKLDGPLLDGFDDIDIFNYLKDNDEYVLAGLVENKQAGLKVSTKRIRNVGDIAKARAEGMTIQPGFVVNKAKSVINKSRVSNRMLHMVDKFYIGPMKLGYLSSLGFLVRNLFDSSIKNAAASKDIGIIPYTFQVWGRYLNYKSTITDLLQKHGDLNTDTIEKYFAGNPKIDKDEFELIYNFIKDGPSAGHSAEVQKYFDDDAKQLYLHARKGADGNPMVSLEEVRQALQDPDDYIRATKDTAKANELLRLKRSQDQLDQAISMANYSKNNALNVDTILRYLQTGGNPPAHLREEYDRIFKFRNERANEMKWEFLIYNKLTQAVTNANSHMEQVFRLTQLLHTMEIKGGTIEEGINNVIKTHFDPSHKTIAEKGLEMMFPFSTFTIKNMHFWLDMMENNGAVGRMFSNMMTPVWDFDNDNRTKWDVYHRRSLQYLISSGNFPISEVTKVEQATDYETGKGKFHYDGSPRMKETQVYSTIKLSPSIMDTINLLLDPVGTAKGRLIAPLEIASDIVLDGQMPSVQDAAIQLVPYWGNIGMKAQMGFKYYDDTQNIGKSFFPSIFGTSKVDSSVEAYRGNPNFDEDGKWVGPQKLQKPIGYNWYDETAAYKKSHRYVPGESYQKKEYPNFSSGSFNGVPRTSQFYSPVYWRGSAPRVSRHARNIWYSKTDFQRDIWTTDMKSKLQLNMMPITPDNIKYRVRH